MKYRAVPKVGTGCTYYTIERWEEETFLFITRGSWRYEATATTEEEAKAMLKHLAKPPVYIPAEEN